jgi:hypothetical protein
MKKMISFLGALALLSIVACKDKAKDAAKITTVSGLKDYSTQVSTKMQQASDHWKERKAKGDTLALPYKDLEAYLPEISGYTSPQGPKGSQINVPGAGGWSEAEQDYVNGDKKVAVKIFDYNSSQQTFMGVTAIYGMGFSFEDDTKKQAPADLGVKDVAAYETVYKKDKRAEMAIVAGDRFLISVEANGDGDEDFVKSIAKNMKLDELAAK